MFQRSRGRRFYVAHEARAGRLINAPPGEGLRVKRVQRAVCVSIRKGYINRLGRFAARTIRDSRRKIEAHVRARCPHAIRHVEEAASHHRELVAVSGRDAGGAGEIRAVVRTDETFDMLAASSVLALGQ